MLMNYSIEIVGFYVGLNLIINLVLAYRVSGSRVKTKIMTGTGDDEGLYNTSRAHITNVEYTPIGLIGLVMLHLLSSSIYVIHLAGALLTIGRILHAIGVSRTGQSSPPRLFGTLLTWISQLVAGLGCLYYALT
ncbi:MAG: hypothetical protein GC184_03030 [Rhizobiales bacterium]|nr:hypothetical protein [Hyphomicrobiales bacterium]